LNIELVVLKILKWISLTTIINFVSFSGNRIKSTLTLYYFIFNVLDTLFYVYINYFSCHFKPH